MLSGMLGNGRRERKLSPLLLRSHPARFIRYLFMEIPKMHVKLHDRLFFWHSLYEMISGRAPEFKYIKYTKGFDSIEPITHRLKLCILPRYITFVMHNIDSRRFV